MTLAIFAGCGGNQKAGGLTIAVIPKGTSHVFWQSIHAGAEKAARELGVTIIWRGPLREDDRDSQVSEVEGFISRGVSGIVIAPLDEAALMSPVADAKRSNIPVVIIVNNNSGFGQNLTGVHRIAGDRLDRGEALIRFGPTDFTAVARSFGVRGIRVERPGAIAVALQQAIAAAAPVVVDVVTALEPRAPEPWAPPR